MSNKKPNREYTKEFIQETLKLVREEHRSVGDVAKSLGVPHSTSHGRKGCVFGRRIRKNLLGACRFVCPTTE